MSMLCALVTLSLTSYASAQQDEVHNEDLKTYSLDNVVITANRNLELKSEANANISVITKEEIQNRHYQNIKEALKNVPGVNISSYSAPGHVTSNSVTINGSKKIVFLVDGVRMNQGAEANLFELYTNMNNIERIEVLHGSASSLYGADAQGGVINIITNKTPANENKITIDSGNFNRLHYSISTQGIDNNFSWYVNAAKDKLGDAKDGHGNKIIQSDDSHNVNMMLSEKLGNDGEKGSISFYYDKYLSKYKYQDPFKGAQLDKGKYETEMYRLLLDYNIDETLTNKLSFYRNERLLSPSWGDTNIISFGVNEQLTKEFSDKNTLTTGIDYQRDKFAEGFAGYGSADYKNMNGTILKNTGYYIQDIHKFDDKINLTVGARYDDNNLFDGKSTGNVKVGYNFNDDSNMYISYGTFFNTPDLYSLYNGKHGNSSLTPENGHTSEIGFNHQFDDSTSMSMHYFDRTTKDKIAYNYTTEKYENLSDKEKAHGFDIQLKKIFDDRWSSNIAYTYLKTDAGKNNINNFGTLPKHTIDFSVDYNLEKINTNFTLRGVIDRPGSNETKSANYPCDTYWLADLGVNYQADKNTKLYFKVNNLFDKYYAEESNVTWGQPGDWWAMPGRSFVAGVEYTF